MVPQYLKLLSNLSLDVAVLRIFQSCQWLADLDQVLQLEIPGR